MNPRISIIVPVYNVEEYIFECIDSILNQTFTDFELILVNDGSNDNSGNICEKYKAIDNRIKVIHKQNGGLSDARNEGLKIANGDYIGFVDSDDIISSNMYEILYNLAEKYNADISSCAMKSFSNNLDNNSSINNGNIRMFKGQDIIKAHYEGKLNQISACNKLYRNNLFEEIKFPKGRIYEDISIIYKLYAKCNTLVESKSDLYFYRRREGSITKSKFSERRFDIIPLYKEQYEFIKLAYPTACDQVKYIYFNNIRCIFVDIINDKELVSKKEYIKRTSDLVKMELSYILKNSLISKNHKLTALFMAYSPNILYLMYKYKINYLRRKENK